MPMTLEEAEKIFESDTWDTDVEQMSDQELSDLMRAFASDTGYESREKNKDNYMYVDDLGKKRLKDLEGKDFSSMSEEEIKGVLSLIDAFGSSTPEIEEMKDKYQERLADITQPELIIPEPIILEDDKTNDSTQTENDETPEITIDITQFEQNQKENNSDKSDENETHTQPVNKELQDLLEEFERAAKYDDIDFLASKFHLLSGYASISPQAASLMDRISSFCLDKAKNAPTSLSVNPLYPEAVLYADYATILEQSDDEEAKRIGKELKTKADTELEKWDKDNGLENIDENMPFNETFEKLRVRPVKTPELDTTNEFVADFLQNAGEENISDLMELAKTEALTELALKGGEPTDEEIQERIQFYAEGIITETYISLGSDTVMKEGLRKLLEEEKEKLKQGEKIAELPNNADLLTFTHYAMTYIEDEKKNNLPNKEEYKAVLEESLNNPDIVQDPQKLAALEYLVEHHDVFGLSEDDPTIKRASQRLKAMYHNASLETAYTAVLAHHTADLSLRATRIAQKTKQPVPSSIRECIAGIKERHPKVAKVANMLIRSGLTMGSSYLLGPLGPLVVSSTYTIIALKKDKKEYAAKHGGSTKGYYKDLFSKENRPKLLAMGSSVVLSGTSLFLGGLGADMVTKAIVRGSLGIVPGAASVSQKFGNLKIKKNDFKATLNKISQKLSDEDKKILQKMKIENFADTDTMTREQSIVFAK